jgi:stearoyl-CoA desaturase (delta-9 desaturase)
MLGVTAGTHRLWSHRTYKAKWPLRVILMLLHTMAFQVCDFLDTRDNCNNTVTRYSSETAAVTPK